MVPPLKEGEPLARHTSLKVGGPADQFAEAHSSADLAALLHLAASQGWPVRMIGGGSNLLVADAGVDGLVVRVFNAGLEIFEFEGQPAVRVAAGATFANVARRVAKLGFGGLEWAANVPGTVGGAVVNNAGAFGGETARDLLAATLVFADGRDRRVTPADLGYAYRTSLLKRRELGTTAVVNAEFRLQPSSPAETQGRIKQLQDQRTRTQPRQLSAGSVFANPPGDYSGRLIEAAGLKGARVGGAQVSPQHANFIVNVDHASAADVYGLVQQVQRTVFDQSGTWLRTEIELLGRWSEAQRRGLSGDLVGATR